MLLGEPEGGDGAAGRAGRQSLDFAVRERLKRWSIPGPEQFYNISSFVTTELELTPPLSYAELTVLLKRNEDFGDAMSYAHQRLSPEILDFLKRANEQAASARNGYVLLAAELLGPSRTC